MFIGGALVDVKLNSFALDDIYLKMVIQKTPSWCVYFQSQSF